MSDYTPLVNPHSNWRTIQRWIVALVTIILVEAVLQAGFTLWQVRASQNQWCQTLDLITSQKVPAPSGSKG